MQRLLVVAFREGEPDRHHEVSSESFIIGRIPEADFVLPHVTVSRKHALLRVKESRVTVEDLGSRNGIFLNGEQVASSAVCEGDFLSVGDYAIVLRILDGAPIEASEPGRTLCLSATEARKRQMRLLERDASLHAGVLYNIALLLGERMKLEQFLHQAVLLTTKTLSACRGAVVLKCPDQDLPEVAASISTDGENEGIPFSRTLIEYVLRTDNALLTDNALTDPRFSTSETMLERKIGAAMCVPLTGSSETGGVLYMDSSNENIRFTDQDFEFFTAMGHLVGLAVENRQLDERLAQNQRLAALGEAVAGISHDVRSVLTGITGGTDLLEQALERMEPDKLASACNIVRKSADQIGAYLSNLLAFVRETGINRSLVCANYLVRDVLDVMALRAEKRNVSLRFLGGGHALVNIDGALMGRVIQNLIENAIDACEDKGGEVSVYIGRKGNTYSIQVTDTGIGIAAKNISRLREPFYSTKVRTGTGLGLAISYRAVEQHGGKIRVVSQLGVGSRFTVLLPDHPDNESESPPGSSRPFPGDRKFRECPDCGVVWPSQEDFLNDTALSLVGYQVHFEKLMAGILQFSHACGTTLAVSVSDFRHLFGGKTFDQRLTDTDACPGYCKSEDELSPCPAECQCAQIREVLQAVRDWPKTAHS
jgi:signal transduction histidine kinase